MKQRSIVLLSLFVTVFVLTIIAGVARTVFVSQQIKEQDLRVIELQQQLAERESAYAALIEQANQQLEQANQQLEIMQVPTAVSAQRMGPANGFSAEKAAEVAQIAAGSETALLGGPDVVDFEGNLAYEFRYEAGNLYIDLTTGKILFDGLPKNISEEQAMKIALEYLGGGKIYKVERTTYEGADVYQLTFWAGYVVNVDMSGQVVYVKLVKYSNASLNSGGGNDDDGGSSDHHNDDDEHDEHDEHEEEDHD